MKNYYDLLEINVQASDSEIKSAIRDFKLKWQQRTSASDLDSRQEAERMMLKAKEMEQTLLNSSEKEKYDQSLALEIEKKKINDEKEKLKAGDEKSTHLGEIDEERKPEGEAKENPIVNEGKAGKAKDFQNTFKTPDEVMKKLEFFYETNEYEQLKIVVRDVIGNDPNNTDLLTYYGYAFYKTNDYRTAESALVKAVNINPMITGWAMSILAHIYFSENKIESYEKYLNLLKANHQDFIYFRIRINLEYERQIQSNDDFLKMIIECPSNYLQEFNKWNSNEKNLGIVEKRIKDNLFKKSLEIIKARKDNLDFKKEINLLRDLDNKLKDLYIDPRNYLVNFHQQNIVEYFVDEILKSYDSVGELNALKGLEIKELTQGVEKRIAALKVETTKEKRNKSLGGVLSIISIFGILVAVYFLNKYNKQLLVLNLNRDNILRLIFKEPLHNMITSPYNFIIFLISISVSLCLASFINININEQLKKIGPSKIIMIGVFLNQFASGARLMKYFHNGVNGIGNLLDVLIIPAIGAGFIAIVVAIPTFIIYNLVLVPLLNKAINSFKIK